MPASVSRPPNRPSAGSRHGRFSPSSPRAQEGQGASHKRDLCPEDYCGPHEGPVAGREAGRAEQREEDAEENPERCESDEQREGGATRESAPQLVCESTSEHGGVAESFHSSRVAPEMVVELSDDSPPPATRHPCEPQFMVELGQKAHASTLSTARENRCHSDRRICSAAPPRRVRR